MDANTGATRETKLDEKMDAMEVHAKEDTK